MLFSGYWTGLGDLKSVIHVQKGSLKYPKKYQNCCNAETYCGDTIESVNVKSKL